MGYSRGRAKREAAQICASDSSGRVNSGLGCSLNGMLVIEEEYQPRYNPIYKNFVEEAK